MRRSDSVLGRWCCGLLRGVVLEEYVAGEVEAFSLDDDDDDDDVDWRVQMALVLLWIALGGVAVWKAATRVVGLVL